MIYHILEAKGFKVSLNTDLIQTKKVSEDSENVLKRNFTTTPIN
ncbi:hypothetical protein [uncultured Clostridium sp.]|nr:hypothetical protein [uncultured Clostridium sp.]